MNKSLLTLILFFLYSLFLSAQINVVGEVSVKWDTFTTIKDRVIFKKYEQSGNTLIGRDTNNKIYRSDDYGKTWIYYFREGEPMVNVNGKQWFLKTSESNRKVEGRLTTWDSNILGSDNFGQSYQQLSTFKSSSYQGLSGLLIHENLGWLPKVNDSIIFLLTYFPQKFYYSIDGGVTFNLFFTRDIAIANPLNIEYAANNFYTVTGKMYKSPHFLNPYYNIDTLLAQNAYSIASKKDTTYLYLTKNNKTKVRITRDTGKNWSESSLPITLLEKKGESTIFQDDKYFYAVTVDGIIRSLDSLFSTYKKISDGINSYSQIPLAFSIVPSGIYMNDANNILLRSKDKGDTWEKIGTNSADLSVDYLVAFDSSSLIHLASNNALIQTKDFKNYSSSVLFYNPRLDLEANRSRPIINGYVFNKTVFINSQYSIDSGNTWLDNYAFVRVENNTLYSIYRDYANVYYFYQFNLQESKWGLKLMNTSYMDTLYAYTLIRNTLYVFYRDKVDKKYYLAKGNVANEFKDGFEKLSLVINENDVKKIFIEENRIVVTTGSGSIFLSEDNGANWLQMSKGIPTIGDYINMDIYKQNIILSTKNGVFITGDYGFTWKRITNFPLKEFVINGQYLYTTSNIPVGIQPLRIHADSLFKNVISEKDYAILTGQLIRDDNANCKKDTHEQGIAEKIIKIEPNGFTTITDRNGRFAIALSPNKYHISTNNILNYNICDDTIIKNIDLFQNQIVERNFLFNPKSTSLAIPSAFTSIQIYPNPTNHYLSIIYDLKQVAWVEINMYNTIGQKVKIVQNKAQNTEGVHQIQADVKDLQAGTYQLEFRTDNGAVYRKFVKM